MDRDQLLFLINQDLMGLGRKDKCMEMVIFTGMMVLHIVGNINMAENMEWVDFYFPQVSITKVNGFMENKMEKEHYFKRPMKLFRKVFGKMEYFYARANDKINLLSLKFNSNNYHS